MRQCPDKRVGCQNNVDENLCDLLLCAEASFHTVTCETRLMCPARRRRLSRWLPSAMKDNRVGAVVDSVPGTDRTIMGDGRSRRLSILPPRGRSSANAGNRRQEPGQAPRRRSPVKGAAPVHCKNNRLWRKENEELEDWKTHFSRVWRRDRHRNCSRPVRIQPRAIAMTI